MKVVGIQIVIGALRTICKGLVKGLEDFEIKGQVDTIQTTALLRVLETWGDLWSVCGIIKDFCSLLYWWVFS